MLNASSVPSEEPGPIPFEAVGGHKDGMFYGPCASDGSTTMEKRTTGWEVMWYTGMALVHNAVDLGALSRQYEEVCQALEAVHTGVVCAPASEVLHFIEALRAFRPFVPRFFSVGLPDCFAAWSAPLAASLSALRGGTSAFQHARDGTLWLDVESGVFNDLIRDLFIELYAGSALLTEFVDTYDNSAYWGVGLVDLTYGLTHDAVMDIKIGYLRHSPLTPPAKLARMKAKEKENLVQDICVRLVGARRFLQCEAAPASTEGPEPLAKDTELTFTKELISRKVGYGLQDVCEFNYYLRRFFSSTYPALEDIAQIHASKTAMIQSVREASETPMVRARICAAKKDVDRLLHFFSETEAGKCLLSQMAFVSTSLLFVYDASRPEAESVTVRLIDFARSGLRRLNFSEDEVRFVDGLKNLSQLLEVPAKSE